MIYHEIHGNTVLPWVTKSGEKFLLVYEFVFDVPENHWAPSEPDRQHIAWYTTPWLMDGSLIYNRFGINEDKFDELIKYDAIVFEKMVNDNLDALNVHAEKECRFIVKQVAISSIPCKLYDREKHEYED